MRAMRTKDVVAVVVACACAAGAASAQDQPPPPRPAPPAAEQPEAPKPASSGFTYDRAGRRDPFVSLVGRGTETPGTNRPAGLAGMLINEVSLKGIVKQSGGFMAMVQGTDKKTYVVRPGQRLLDGTVKSITSDAVIFAQDVNDPLSLVKQREVRKTLRSSEDNRG